VRNLNPFSWIILAIVVVCFTAVGFGIRDNRHAVAVATRALCEQRGAAKRQLASARAFLKANPDGAFGFSRTQVLVAIKQDKASVDALKDVKCTP
jgi:hypothetical protein